MSTLTAHFDLPRDLQAPGWARRAVTALLLSWGLHEPDWSADVSAVVSELVTNAIRHGGGSIALDLEAHDRDVVVSVSDGSPALPRPREPDETGGLGLVLIESLTVRWYVQAHHGGKRVRAQLPPCPSGGDADAVSARSPEPA
ncbi:ATP-binding protein [Actinoplanes aureus]|jgi:anti-sigma regulatory factor (Ser/Thr protein kinase)|uniref:ATP-binding protein n=1 Tax=Actinoplanes aureus TaxID=2792083 RepID=A0A931FZF2_9ACTN|nr:ATP-binding protein [Actinoplanes aureus]MBG0564702.1 ATP-binding protein [Actinoplanes aureus]